MILKGCLVALSFVLASPLFELEGMETDAGFHPPK